MRIDSVGLDSHVALYSLLCSDCGNEIEIGDDCWIDSSAGNEENKALIYCVNCVDS